MEALFQLALLCAAVVIALCGRELIDCLASMECGVCHSVPVFARKAL